MRVNLPKREELWFITVLAFPNVSRIGLHSSTFSDRLESKSDARLRATGLRRWERRLTAETRTCAAAAAAAAGRGGAGSAKGGKRKALISGIYRIRFGDRVGARVTLTCS